MRRIAISVIALVCACVLAAPAHANNAVENPAPDADSSHGITVAGSKPIDDRQTEYTVEADTLDQPVRIRVVMPSDFKPGKRYPVLYLYHGTSGAPSNWPDSGELLETTDGLDLITVLPESGYDGDGGGWFVDWWNHGKRGNPQWETFLVDQVTGWVDNNFPTIADREHRAVAGLSQGGFGAMHAAARHPDMYASAASFSGAPEIYRDILIRAGADFIIEGTTWVITPGNIPFSTFGDPITNGVHWAGHDPGTLVENLHGMQIGLWTASGLPGERDSLDNAYGGGAGNIIEQLTHMSTLAFEGHLQDAGIDHHFKDTVVGTHHFGYWAQHLREYIPMMMRRFANPTRPAAISYASIEPAWSQWGWTVKTNRNDDDERFTFLRDADRDGFTFQGRNKARIRTPSQYQPGKKYRVTTTGSHDDKTQILRADATGHLEVPVNLGRAKAPADLSFLGLPGRLGHYPDATAVVQISAADTPAPPPPDDPPSPVDESVQGLVEDTVNPLVRAATLVLNGVLSGVFA